MGREIREIPLNWQHPKDARGAYIPHHCEVMDPEYRAECGEDWKDEWAEAYLAEPWPADAPMGYALYENVTEGTPLTPTFATRAEVADYLATHGDFWGNRWSREAADGVARTGYAPSMVMLGGRVFKPNDAEMYS